MHWPQGGRIRSGVGLPAILARTLPSRVSEERELDRARSAIDQESNLHLHFG